MCGINEEEMKRKLKEETVYNNIVMCNNNSSK